ncbi:MAG: TonB family protein [Dysgonamonadaceae bacterium]|jgi:TonB family protein|nr:TonB family protein [Dysgonamonadaceae bacterium]
MNDLREKIYGYSGSAIFCFLLSLLLWFTVIRTSIKKPEIGIPVMFEDDLAGASSARLGTTPTDEIVPPPPAPSNPVPQPQIEKPAVKPVQKPATKPNSTPAITQNAEKTAEISEAEKQKQLEQQRLAEQQRQQEAINKQISGALSGSTASGQTASTSGSNSAGSPSNAGSPSGSASGNASKGSGSDGWGSFNLGGRSLGQGGLQKPAYTVNIEGKIVVNIIVDPKGNVISTEIGRGTTIDNNQLRNAAITAAKKTKFNSISGTNNQSGTITYTYWLK